MIRPLWREIDECLQRCRPSVPICGAVCPRIHRVPGGPPLRGPTELWAVAESTSLPKSAVAAIAIAYALM